MHNFEIKRIRFGRITYLGILLLLSASCTKIGNYAEKRADSAAYANIRGAQLSGLGKESDFQIADKELERVRKLLAMDRMKEEPEMLSLSDALAIAIANSRSYQTRKETLYLQALVLTETQNDFNWNLDGTATAESSYRTFENGSAETFGDNGIDAQLGATLKKTLFTGAKVTLNYTQNLVALFSDPDASDIDNAFSFNIVQPLLNGVGPLVSLEPLRQAERDLVYAVRDFKRFEQDFVIDITSQYYALLRSRDQLENERKNYESSIANREQTESYAKAGRIADFQAAQARQSELNAADRWTLSQSSYQNALDDFRFTLGLPIDLNVAPNPEELARLVERGMVQLDISLDEAMNSAVSNRLDLVNQRQRLEDRGRKLEISRRDFLPNLDVNYTTGERYAGNERSDLNVSLDIPFNWTEKRNAFRRAQINLDRAERSLSEDEDNILRTVRNLWRTLDRNRSVYGNRLLSVTLAERRVENTQLLLKQGKALTRDLLDAQDDLLSAKNAATAALVDFTVNRLRFWNAIERFEIDPKGMWYEQTTPQEPVATP